MTPTILLALTLAYVMTLLGVASYHDRGAAYRPTSPFMYAMTLAVFCTSWTFYGAVGSMAAKPWSHTTIYLGPILLLTLGSPIMDRLRAMGHRQKVTSIADFLGARYGKRQSVASIVAVICLIAILPYLSLQFRALQQIWAVVNTGDVAVPQTSADNVTLLVAVGLAAFAILFGARRLDGSERQRGLMQAMAVESIVKLLAFVFIAGLCVVYLASDSTPDVAVPSLAELPVSGDFWAQLLIAALAIMCLPRQFHVGVVELDSIEQAKTSRWLFPLYLFLFMILAVPIALAGGELFKFNPDVTADTYVQMVPMVLDSEFGTALAFLGGVSAATGMVLVSTVSVAIMVTNELVTPLLFRLSIARSQALLNLGTLLRRSRQFTIAGISIAAWVVAAGLSSLPQLTQIGFLSFLGSVQMAPPLLLGMYWRRTHGAAVFWGMFAGAAIWLLMGVIPAMHPSEPWLLVTILGDHWWDRAAALSFAQITTLSLGLNTALCILLSLILKPKLADIRQAIAFIDGQIGNQPLDTSPSAIPVIQLKSLVAPLLSDVALQRFWRELETSYEQRLLPSDRAPRFVVSAVESVLANAVGATSARQILKRLAEERQLDVHDLTQMLGDAQKANVFNRDSLEAAVENLSHGVSVVDADLRLVAWNNRYAEMFDYPARFLFVGCPIERVYRFNAERGILSTSGRSLEEEIDRRLQYMREASPHNLERVMPDGRVLDIRGTPLPGGGFVTTYVDITEYRETATALSEARSELEARLASGEEVLSQRNAELRKEVRLRSEAENQLRAAYQSKSQFMSATSHDLLQPINAARLFAVALESEVTSEQGSEHLAQINLAISRAQQMISELREMARLEAGGQPAVIAPTALEPVLNALQRVYAEQAHAKGLEFKYVATDLWVSADESILRRLLENIVANAVKYTRSGKVLLGVRRRGDRAIIQVCDTGPGIAIEDKGRIFEAFERLNRAHTAGVDGLGLGLSLVSAYAELIGAEVDLHSTSGRGSIFEVSLPVVEPQQIEVSKVEFANADLSGVVLALDNDTALLSGLAAMLEQWGLEVKVARNREEASQWLSITSMNTPVLMIVDFHLDDGDTGLAVATMLREQGINTQVLVVSADDSPEVRAQARAAGFRFLPKPIEPNRLRTLLEALTAR